jgi:hypothetical protein
MCYDEHEVNFLAHCLGLEEGVVKMMPSYLIKFSIGT